MKATFPIIEFDKFVQSRSRFYVGTSSSMARLGFLGVSKGDRVARAMEGQDTIPSYY